MKKVFLIFVLVFQYVICQAAAVSISISGFAFSPATITVQVNDVITWTNLDNANHSIVSTGVPGGAAAFSSNSFGQNGTFSYTVTVAGEYTYKCGVHPSMVGSFSTSSTTPVAKPTLTLNTLYPNPAVDNVHIESPATIASVEIYSETGAFIKSLTFSSAKIDVSVSELRKGAYLLRIVSEEGLVETRRIVKM